MGRRSTSVRQPVRLSSPSSNQATTLVDLGVHELRDVLEPMRLYRLENGAFVSDRRPPRTGGVRAGNVPTAIGELLGREADVEDVIADLRTASVVTLIGVGGIGKTRLALEVGRRVQAAWRDGVWFAALDTIDRPDALVPVLLGIFSIEARAERDLDSLIEGLRVRHALLILDNCGMYSRPPRRPQAPWWQPVLTFRCSPPRVSRSMSTASGLDARLP